MSSSTSLNVESIRAESAKTDYSLLNSPHNKGVEHGTSPMEEPDANSKKEDEEMEAQLKAKELEEKIRLRFGHELKLPMFVFA